MLYQHARPTRRMLLIRFPDRYRRDLKQEPQLSGRARSKITFYHSWPNEEGIEILSPAQLLPDNFYELFLFLLRAK